MSASDSNPQAGPLSGVRVVEMAGLGPAPFCGMLLSDMGAEVLRIDRPESPDYRPEDVESRGRHSVVIDLKQTSGRALALALIEKADVLIEGFRPGVMERLGLGPSEAFAVNPALVYGRVTGFGQDGPMAHLAGHDLNFLALSGALHALGTRQSPAVPLNLIADFGGGALYLAMGVLAALHHAQKTGQGQVVDSAMTDGVISMLAMIYGDYAVGAWTDERESNVIDGAAPFYNVYQCADGGWLSVAAIEPKFHDSLIGVTGVDKKLFAEQWKRQLWPEQKAQLAAVFSKRTRDEWQALFAEHDACIVPVLSLEEAGRHPHNVSRGNFEEVDGIVQPGPVPRFSQTPSAIAFGCAKKDADRDEILERWEVPQDLRRAD